MARFLCSYSHHARKHWRREAGSTEHCNAGLPGDGLNDLDTGERISHHGYVRHLPGCAWDAALEIGLGEGEAGTATSAEDKADVHRRDYGRAAQLNCVSDAGFV